MKKQVVVASLLIWAGLSQAQSNIYENNGNVGIGTSIPTQKLTVDGSINISNPAIGHYLGFGNPGNNEYNAIGSMYSGAGLTLAHGLKPSNSTNKMVYSYPAMARSAILMGSGFISGGIKFYTKSYSGEMVGADFNDNPRMIIADNGYVGIGVDNPTTMLETAGALTINPGSSDKNYLLFRNNGTSVGLIGSSGSIYGNNESNFGLFVYGNNNMEFSTNSSKRLIIDGAGGVAIGAATMPGYKLAVGGNIIAEQIRVKLQSSGWPDYVFKPGYQLMPLYKVERFIREKGHLPELPSAKDVSKNGMELGSNQALLLKKIEELTLHLIQMEKRNNEQDKEIERLKNKLQSK